MSILDEILNSSDDDDDDYEETEDENTEDSDDEENLETDSNHEMSREEKEFLEAVQFAQQVERINQAIAKVAQDENGIQADDAEDDDDSDGNVISDTIEKAIDKINKTMAERHSDSDRINYQQAPQPVDISSGNNNGNNLGAPNNYNIGNNAGYAQQQGFQSNAPQPNNTTPHQYGNANNVNNGGNYGNTTYSQQPQSNNYQNNGYNQSPTVNNPGQKGSMPTTYLWQSIVVTLLCCLPFGIVGIIYANKVSDLYIMGNYEEAQNASGKAKTWTIVSLCVGLGFWLLYFLLIIIGACADL